MTYTSAEWDSISIEECFQMVKYFGKVSILRANGSMKTLVCRDGKVCTCTDWRGDFLNGHIYAPYIPAEIWHG